MDGRFVPNLTFGAPVVKCLRKKTDMFFDCHLMVEQPENYVDAFAAAGADMIVIHTEATKHLHRVLEAIQWQGHQGWCRLNPASSSLPCGRSPPLCVYVLIMSVNPGFGGQKFIETSIDKIHRLKERIKQGGYKTLIEVDGGINKETGKAVREAGADVLVAGSYIFGSPDMKKAISYLR